MQFRVMAAGLALPFLTWFWAKAIDERLVFESFPDPTLLVFNGIAFALLAVAALYVSRAAVVSGFLFLLAISIQLHMSSWQLRSSTSALVFLF